MFLNTKLPVLQTLPELNSLLSDSDSTECVIFVMIFSVFLWEDKPVILHHPQIPRKGVAAMKKLHAVVVAGLLCTVVGACSSSSPSSVVPPHDEQFQASTPIDPELSDPSISESLPISQIGDPYDLEDSQPQSSGVSLASGNQRFPFLCKRWPNLASCISTPTPKPSPTPQPTPTPSANCTPANLTGFAAQVLDLTNQERTSRGLPALIACTAPSNAALNHAQDMAVNDYFSHTGLNGSSPTDRARQAGYDGSCGENIAAGQFTPQEVMNSWMNSSGHRSNILNASYVHIGIGYYYLANDGGSRNYNHYWVQKFCIPN